MDRVQSVVGVANSAATITEKVKPLVKSHISWGAAGLGASSVATVATAAPPSLWEQFLNIWKSPFWWLVVINVVLMIYILYNYWSDHGYGALHQGTRTTNEHRSTDCGIRSSPGLWAGADSPGCSAPWPWPSGGSPHHSCPIPNPEPSCSISASAAWPLPSSPDISPRPDSPPVSPSLPRPTAPRCSGKSKGIKEIYLCGVEHWDITTGQCMKP